MPKRWSMADRAMGLITARLPPALIDRLTKIAVKIDRSASWCIRAAVSEWVAKQERKR